MPEHKHDCDETKLREIEAARTAKHGDAKTPSELERMRQLEEARRMLGPLPYCREQFDKLADTLFGANGGTKSITTRLTRLEDCQVDQGKKIDKVVKLLWTVFATVFIGMGSVIFTLIWTHVAGGGKP